MLRTTNPASTRPRTGIRQAARRCLESHRRHAEWTPDPDLDADGRHPSDPDWLHDTDADLAPEVDR